MSWVPLAAAGWTVAVTFGFALARAARLADAAATRTFGARGAAHPTADRSQRTATA